MIEVVVTTGLLEL